MAVDEALSERYQQEGFYAGMQLMKRDLVGQAALAFKAVLELNPTHVGGLLGMMGALPALGLQKQANHYLLRLYKLQRAGVPIGLSFSKETTEILSKVDQEYPPFEYIQLSETEAPRVALSTTRGRFGNILYQYLFLKIYARKFGYRAEMTQWDGRSIFSEAANDAYPSYPLPFCFDERPIEALFGKGAPLKNVDLCAYLMLKGAEYAPYRTYIRSILTPKPEIEIELQSWVRKVRAGCDSLVVMHLRLTDFLELFPNWSPTIYCAWIRDTWPKLKNPRLYIATDDPPRVRELFADYAPIIGSPENLNLLMPSYYPDFYMLTQADVLALSRSTFSTMGSLLNSRARMFVRPSATYDAVEEFDPWEC